jgi:hypothetical protein
LSKKTTSPCCEVRVAYIPNTKERESSTQKLRYTSYLFLFGSVEVDVDSNSEWLFEEKVKEDMDGFDEFFKLSESDIAQEMIEAKISLE